MNFSSIGGVPVSPSDKKFDFSSIGGIPIDQQQPSLDQFKTNVVKNIIGNQFSNAAKTVGNALTLPGRLIQQGVESLPGFIAEKTNLSPEASAAIGLLPATLTRAALPQTNTEVALMAAGGLGGKLLGPAISEEAKLIGPVTLQDFFGVPEKAGRELMENPNAVADLSKLGPKGIAQKAVQSVQNARTKLVNLIKNSNSDYNAIQNEIIEKTANQPIIPIQDIISETNRQAIEKGLEEGIPLTDRVGLSVINRTKASIQKLSQEGALSFDSYNKLRVMLNAAMQNSKLSKQAISVLTAVKNGLDSAAESSLGQDLASKYHQVVDQSSYIKGLASSIGPIIDSNNAPKLIAQHLDSGSIQGQALDEFDNLTDGVLKPIKTAIRAQFFSQKQPIAMSTGSTGANIMKGVTTTAAKIPFLGRLVRPPGIANMASSISNIFGSPVAQTYAPKLVAQGLFNANRR